MHNVAFPGLGLEFNLDPVAFTIFGIQVKWYGVIITCGIMCALYMFYRYARKKEDLPENHLFNLALITIPTCIVGARVMYVITEWDRYSGDFMAMINIREGGLAIYGAILTGIICVFAYGKITKLNILRLMDAAAPAVCPSAATNSFSQTVHFCASVQVAAAPSVCAPYAASAIYLCMLPSAGRVQFSSVQALK